MTDLPAGGAGEFLHDRDWKLRRQAVLDLGYARDTKWLGTLVEALDDPDGAVRQAAVLSLGRLGVPEVVEELTKPKVMGCEDPEVRRTALAVLGRIGGIEILDAVSEALADPDWTVRNEAIAAVETLVDQLSELRIPGTARVLVRMLPIDDPDVREKTIRSLAAFGKPAVSVLIEALSVKSERVRSGAAAALGLMRDPATVPPLVRLLGDEGKEVRLSAITALGNIPSPLIEALEHARCEVAAAEAIRALAHFVDERALVPILNYLGHTYMTVRGEAVDAIARYGVPAIPHLTEMLLMNRVPLEPLVKDALRNPRKRNRLRTIRALGELKDSRAVPALKQIGQEDDREIREAVEHALRKIGSATWARASAAETLGRIGSSEGVEALTRQLTDPNSTVRLRVTKALAAIGDGAAARPLAKLLTDEPDEEVREQAVFALGRIGRSEPAAVTACIRALADDSRSVRSRAARALGRLADSRAALPLVRALGDSYWSVRRDAENSILNLGARVVPPLIESLRSRKFVVRLRATRSLGAIGDRRAASPLRKLLRTEPDESVREAIEEALASLEGK